MPPYSKDYLQNIDSITSDVEKYLASTGLANAGVNIPTDTGKDTGMFGGLGKLLNSTGITGPEGQLLGLSKDQQAGLGNIAGLGSDLWNMYNANNQYGLAKDYYGKQMELQDKQMARVDKEDARMDSLRSGLGSRY